MKPRAKYFKHFNLTEPLMPTCECGCGADAEGIFPLSKHKDKRRLYHIENLVALTVKCHLFTQIHFHFAQTVKMRHFKLLMQHDTNTDVIRYIDESNRK